MPAESDAGDREVLIRISREQIRISSRPWVGISDDPDGMSFTSLILDKDATAWMSYKLKAKNFGTAGAQNILPLAMLVITEDFKMFSAAGSVPPLQGAKA